MNGGVSATVPPRAHVGHASYARSGQKAAIRTVSPVRFQLNSAGSESGTSAPGVLEAALLSHSWKRVPHAQPTLELTFAVDTSFIKDIPKFSGRMFVEWLDDFESRASLAGLEESRMKSALLLSLEPEVFTTIKSLIYPARPQEASVTYSRLVDLMNARYNSSGGVHLSRQKILAIKQTLGQDFLQFCAQLLMAMEACGYHMDAREGLLIGQLL